MRKLTPYKPRLVDIAWANNTVIFLRDGGTIGTSSGIYRIDKANKTITLVMPLTPWDNPVTLLHHHRHCCVWKEIGYTVEPVVDWDKLELSDRMPEDWESKEIPPDVWDEIKRFFLGGSK